MFNILLFDPGPLKNAGEKMPLRSFYCDFRAEISRGEPDCDLDHLKQCDSKIKHVLQKMIPYASPGQTARTRMTAHGFSSLRFSPKTVDVDAVLQYTLSHFVNNTFCF